VIPTFVSYCPRCDRAKVWLKGGAGPGEIVRTLLMDRTLLGFDATGYLVLVEIAGEALHPDLAPYTAREYPAEGDF
jgi:hypothetical protein